MVELYNMAITFHALPAPGGLLDQDWEVVIAFQILAQWFGGLNEVMARRACGGLLG